MPNTKTKVPQKIKPYLFHGLDLTYDEDDKDAIGECPFCESDRFGVKIETGEFNCYKCKESGNIPTFIKKLWNDGDKMTTDYSELQEEKQLLYPETLMHWGIIRSPITGQWLVPGYNTTDQTVGQLYRYSQMRRKKRLLATSGLTHKIFGLNLFDQSKDTVYICEGPWDAMVLWEILGQTKQTDNGLATTGNQDISLRASSNVIALPGCNVFNSDWCNIFEGFEVVICFDNDHPKKHSKTGKTIPPAGLSGVERLAGILSNSSTPPESISFVRWGSDGYDLELPSGYDLRDCLVESAISGLASRLRAFERLQAKLCPVPPEWLKEPSTDGSKNGDSSSDSGIKCLECTSYKELILAWKKALKWTAGLDHALASMLASVASTRTIGDPLWLKIIGPAACGKSTLCEAVSVNTKHVLAKSTIRGFHSGYRLDGEEGEQDNSLLGQLNGKTLVTKDGDTLLQSPNLGQILSEARDVYDGTSRTHYRNAMSKDYDDIKMTWLLCGTSSLRSIDSSELGERFLDCVIMEKIDDELENEILWRVANRANSNLSIKLDGEVESRYDPALLLAMQLTGGYIDFLKEDTDKGLAEIEMPTRALKKCAKLGKFVAHLRARPSLHQNENAERELASRLVSQHIRLAKCLALVLNHKTIDEVVMYRVRRISLDTARGVTYDICKQLFEAKEEGMEPRAIALRIARTDSEIRGLLRFLKQIEVVEHFNSSKVRGLKGTPKWRLTNRLQKLYAEVMGEL